MNQSAVESAKEIFDRRMSAEQLAHTKAWWGSLVQDKARLVAWLQKLYNSEIHGFQEYMAFIDRYRPDAPTQVLLRQLADDERRHAAIIQQCLGYWGEMAIPGTTKSQYWNEMQRHTHDFKSACAVKFYGEHLASQRFIVLRDDPFTPDDLFHAFRWIGPDEEAHCGIMYTLAGPEAIVKMEEHHLKAVANLLKKNS